MLKKVLILVISLFLGFNIVNAFNEPYYFVELSKNAEYSAEYEFLSYKYGTVDVYIESSTKPGQKELIGLFYLNDLFNIHNFKPLDLSLLFYRNSGILNLAIDEDTGDTCIYMRNNHPRKMGLCQNNPFNIDFRDYEISYKVNKQEYRVTLVKGTSRVNENTFEIYAVFNHKGGAFKKVIYD